MRRRLLNLVAMLSMLVCALSAIGLVASRFRTDVPNWCGAGRYWGAQSTDASLLLLRVDNPFITRRRLAWEVHPPGAYADPAPNWAWHTEPRTGFRGPGVRVIGEADSILIPAWSGGGTHYALQIWYPPVIGATAIAPALWLAVRLRRRRRPRGFAVEAPAQGVQR